MISSLILAITVALPSVSGADVLEPSVENEVLHALSRAPAFVPAGGTLTNGAIWIVSHQRADGRFIDGTNDVTAAAVRTLRALADVPPPKLKLSIFASHIDDIVRQTGLSFEEAARKTAALGYAGVDVYEGTDAARLATLRRAGFEIPCVIATPRFEAAYDADWAASLVAYAVTNGIPRIMLVPGFFTAEGDRAEEAARIAERTERFARLAAEKGLVTLVEDFDAPDSPTRDISSLRNFFAAAPSVRLVFDTGNFAFSGESALEADALFADRIAHYHLKDRPASGTRAAVPVGKGVVPLAELLARALARGYDGWFTVEHFGVDDMLSAATESISFFP